MKQFTQSIGAAALLLVASCGNPSSEEKTSALGLDGWLSGTTEEKFEEVADQLQGFSTTMVEVSYRYSELYWAGMDENWEYAEHQLEHLEEAIELGLKRRPLRAASAEDFMEVTIPEMEALIAGEDKEAFLKGFQSFTSACNACHAKEGEAFIKIKTPEARLSPVRW
ncbi:MAG: hypothetical protein ACXIT9_11890 [Nitritalea sp.]